MGDCMHARAEQIQRAQQIWRKRQLSRRHGTTPDLSRLAVAGTGTGRSIEVEGLMIRPYISQTVHVQFPEYLKFPLPQWMNGERTQQGSIK